MSKFFTLDDVGREVEADENGRALKVIINPNEPPQDIPEEDSPQMTTQPDDDEDNSPEETTKPEAEDLTFDDLPKDISDEGLIIRTDSGWVTFRPEHILDEGDVLVLFLKDKADAFIPCRGARFVCRWKRADGTPQFEKLYFAGFRFKLPGSENTTVLGFLKVP